MSDLKTIEIIVCFLLIMSAIGFGVAFGKIDILKNQIKLLTTPIPKHINCAHCKKYDVANHRCIWWDSYVSNIDWCSYAERKENE